MASLANVEHRNQEATCYVGNLDPSCSESLLLELFSQIGRVLSVHMPKDKLTSSHNGYGFVEFIDVADAEYAIQIMSMVKLHGRMLRVSKSSLDKKTSGNSLDVGANLFLGNLDPDDVNEKLLYDTFSSFGTIIKPPKIMRDEVNDRSKGYGFVSYDSFEASDLAIECMNNQFLCNRQITVQYAFKKASNTEETGQAGGGAERHGSRAERMLAANNPMKKHLGTGAANIRAAAVNGMANVVGNNATAMAGMLQKNPNTMFATTSGSIVPPPPPPPITGVASIGMMQPPLPPPPLPPPPLSTTATNTVPAPPPLPPPVTSAGSVPPPLPPPPTAPPPLPPMSAQQTWGQPPPPPPLP